MRWILILVLAACESKPASPKPAPPERVVTSVRRTTPRTESRPAKPREVWIRAEAAPTAAAWDDAAEVYADELAACDCADAAYAVVLARKNALLAEPAEPPPGDDPAPVPPRVQALIAALDAYLAVAEPDDPDLPGMHFLAGSAFYRFRQPDAIARFETLLRDHRDDPSAEYAANTLLDLLLRSGRIDDAKRWVAELSADETFLAGKDALRATLERLRAMFSGSQ